MGTRSVAFEVQQPGAFAVQLRLTPALLDALLGDDASAATICFGASQQGVSPAAVGGRQRRRRKCLLPASAVPFRSTHTL